MAFDAPLSLNSQKVRPEWTDPNGHMNVAYHVMTFDWAMDVFCNMLGVGWDYTKQGDGTLFIVEMHNVYLEELLTGDSLGFTLQLLDADEKRIHYFLRMYRNDGETPAAASEQMALHLDVATRRTSPLPAACRSTLAEMMETHAKLETPEQAGQIIGIRRTT